MLLLRVHSFLGGRAPTAAHRNTGCCSSVLVDDLKDTQRRQRGDKNIWTVLREMEKPKPCTSTTEARHCVERGHWSPPQLSVAEKNKKVSPIDRLLSSSIYDANSSCSQDANIQRTIYQKEGTRGSVALSHMWKRNPVTDTAVSRVAAHSVVTTPLLETPPSYFVQCARVCVTNTGSVRERTATPIRIYRSNNERAKHILFP